MQTSFASILILLTFLGTGFGNKSVKSVKSIPIKRLSVSVTTKKLNKGKLLELKSEVYHVLNGRTITHFLPPVNFVIIAEADGRLTLVDSRNNKIESIQSPGNNDPGSWLAVFGKRKMNDIGLKDLGFELTDSRFEDPYQITSWSLQNLAGAKAASVELVHLEGIIVHCSYSNSAGEVFRKTWFKGGFTEAGFWFPSTITSFNYHSPKDSTIEKLYFENLKVNEDAASEWFDYQLNIEGK